ncbi:PulJ/GspJ family protein [Glaciecola sp. 2405UD65-10]|uniref:PulJ/GspJ family protein n=1 Tax=Glaciecola sp. 2405UD65-10 TaxID=3397244 RepID=UPI003B5BB1F4
MQGFTLIELILVIVILGIVSISVSGIIRSTINVVADVSERENLVREGSFVVERLSRELNSAVPNSVRITANASSHCIEFVPLKWSTTYLSLPLAAETNTTADVVELLDIDDNTFVPSTSDWGIVYPTQASEVYDASLNHRQGVDSCSDDGDGNCATNDDSDGVVQVTFADGFNASSPSKRIYFADQAISYCMRNNEIYRHTSTINTTQTLYTGGGQLMAQNLVNVLGANTSSGEQNPFQIVDASLQRGALTSLLLIFGREDEHVTFMQEVQIPNVP